MYGSPSLPPLRRWNGTARCTTSSVKKLAVNLKRSMASLQRERISMGKSKRARQDEPTVDPLKRKEYERHLSELHVELVKLQEWVKHKGLKVCIAFEGRDGAGKGGTIKAITERVSPRVFRVVALPA